MSASAADAVVTDAAAAAPTGGIDPAHSAFAPALAFGGVQAPEAPPTLGLGDHGHKPIESSTVMRVRRTELHRLIRLVMLGRAPERP